LFLSYEVAKDYLEEADILLFRSKSWTSFFIRQASRSTYSHVGLASWHNGCSNGLWELVEFREFKGGRTTSLERAVQKDSGKIDVYRPSYSRQHLVFNKNTMSVNEEWITIDKKAITLLMRKLTGLPYGWKRIWWFAQWYIPGLRLIYDVNKIMDDTVGEVIYPVCSTAISYAFSYNDFDLLNNRSDEWVQPGDIALSSNLNYMFTLK